MVVDDRSRYYRDVTALFLRLRGAPFILSARELHLLAAWEKQGIPLNVVQEGIENAFQAFQKASGPDRRPVSLQACDPYVRGAFGQVKDRRAGGRRLSGGREDKRRAMARAIKDFLEALPIEWAFLRQAFEQALRLIESAGGGEEDLERLETDIEQALASHCPAEEWDRAQKQLGPACAAGKGKALLRRMALKNIREKYKIPYVSYPYY